MADKQAPQTKPAKTQSREERLKAALKQNMARRKAQARARADEAQDNKGEQDG